MKEIIFDEKSQIEEILKKKTLENISIKGFIILLAKYYFEEYKDLTAVKYKKELQKIIQTMNMPFEYREFLYDTFIDRVCRNLRNGKYDKELKQISQINITKTEMDVVRQGETDKEQKFLFTLFVLAKTVLNPTGWVNYKDNQIMTYGNLKGCSSDALHSMIHKLWKKGLMDFNHKIDAHGYKIELGEDVEDVELIITRMNNFGNQCMAYLKTDWKMCECCGRMIKIKNKDGRPQKYCKKCAEKIEHENAIKRKQKQRNMTKNVTKN